MKLRVISAIGGGEIQVDVHPQDPIRKIKEKIAQQRNIPANSVILVYRGQQLEEDSTVKAVGISEMDRVYLIARTEGGI